MLYYSFLQRLYLILYSFIYEPKSYEFKRSTTFLSIFSKSLLLSWFFALCAQIIIPLPYSPVPLYLHPLPLFLAVLWHKEVGFYGYLLYLMQGALGLPFFSRCNGGLWYLFFAPTAGYLWGFLLALAFFLALQNGLFSRLQTFKFGRLFLLLGCAGLYFSLGIAGLQTIIGWERALATGLFSCLPGDLIKIMIIWYFWNQRHV